MKRIIVGLLLATCIMGISGQAEEREGKLAFVDNGKWIYMREQATTDSQALAILDDHASVYIYEEMENGWVEVSSGAYHGYVKKERLATGEKAEQIAAQEGKEIGIVCPEALNIRVAPNSGEPIDVTYQGQELVIQGRDGDWLKVVTPAGVEGYVHAKYCDYTISYPVARAIEAKEKAALETRNIPVGCGEMTMEDLMKEIYGDEPVPEKTEKVEAEKPAPEETKQETPKEEAAKEATTQEAVTQVENQNAEQSWTDTPQVEEVQAEEAWMDAPQVEDVQTEEVWTDVPQVEDTQTEEVWTDAPLVEDVQATEAWTDVSQVEDVQAEEVWADVPQMEEPQEEAWVDVPQEEDLPGQVWTDNTALEETVPETTTSSLNGQAIVDYATQFVGNKYVWGGTDPVTGSDCSGFTQAIYSNFGIDIPRVADSQKTAGTEVSIENAQAGDLLFFGENGGTADHVAIYMGNNMIVHSSSEETGVIISDVSYGGNLIGAATYNVNN